MMMIREFEKPIPPGFFIHAPVDARAVFSTNFGTRKPRGIPPHPLPLPALVARSINNDIELHVDRRVRLLQDAWPMQTGWIIAYPQQWEDLYEFFDAFDLYTEGAGFLHLVMNELVTRNIRRREAILSFTIDWAVQNQWRIDSVPVGVSVFHTLLNDDDRASFSLDELMPYERDLIAERLNEFRRCTQPMLANGPLNNLQKQVIQEDRTLERCDTFRECESVVSSESTLYGGTPAFEPSPKSKSTSFKVRSSVPNNGRPRPDTTKIYGLEDHASPREGSSPSISSSVTVRGSDDESNNIKHSHSISAKTAFEVASPTKVGSPRPRSSHLAKPVNLYTHPKSNQSLANGSANRSVSNEPIYVHSSLACVPEFYPSLPPAQQRGTWQVSYSSQDVRSYDGARPRRESSFGSQSSSYTFNNNSFNANTSSKPERLGNGEMFTGQSRDGQRYYGPRWSRPRYRDPTRQVCIDNLDPSRPLQNRSIIGRLFGEIGEIHHVSRMVPEGGTRMYVTFDDPEAAQRAINRFNNTEINGSVVSVDRTWDYKNLLGSDRAVSEHASTRYVSHTAHGHHGQVSFTSTSSSKDHTEIQTEAFPNWADDFSPVIPDSEGNERPILPAWNQAQAQRPRRYYPSKSSHDSYDLKESDYGFVNSSRGYGQAPWKQSESKRFPPFPSPMMSPFLHANRHSKKYGRRHSSDLRVANMPVMMPGSCHTSGRYDASALHPHETLLSETPTTSEVVEATTKAGIPTTKQSSESYSPSRDGRLESVDTTSSTKYVPTPASIDEQDPKSPLEKPETPQKMCRRNSINYLTIRRNSRVASAEQSAATHAAAQIASQNSQPGLDSASTAGVVTTTSVQVSSKISKKKHKAQNRKFKDEQFIGLRERPAPKQKNTNQSVPSPATTQLSVSAQSFSPPEQNSTEKVGTLPRVREAGTGKANHKHQRKPHNLTDGSPNTEVPTTETNETMQSQVNDMIWPTPSESALNVSSNPELAVNSSEPSSSLPVSFAAAAKHVEDATNKQDDKDNYEESESQSGMLSQNPKAGQLLAATPELQPSTPKCKPKGKKSHHKKRNSSIAKV